MECGARRCPPLSFCHDATNACKDCADICDAGRPSHYEPGLCYENCRDYLYEQRSPAIDGTARLLGAVGVGAGLVAVIGLLLLGGMVLFCVYRRPRQLLNLLQARAAMKAASDHREDVDTPEMKVKMTNNNKCDIGRDLNNSSVCTVSGSISEPELRMNLAGHAAPQQPPIPALPQLHVLGGLSPAVPPPPARHPSEDSTLDYAAYDNPALSPSSSPLPGAVGSGSGGGHPKAMDAVLEAVLDHSSLPGSVPHGLQNGTANGSVARMESSF